MEGEAEGDVAPDIAAYASAPGPLSMGTSCLIHTGKHELAVEEAHMQFQQFSPCSTCGAEVDTSHFLYICKLWPHKFLLTTYLHYLQ